MICHYSQGVAVSIEWVECADYLDYANVLADKCTIYCVNLCIFFPNCALRFVINLLRVGSCGDETAEPPDDQATFKPNT